MSELRSALEDLRSETLTGLPDARIEDEFAELVRIGELLELERLRRLVEIQRRGLHRRDGHLSLTAWLAGQFKVGWGPARMQARFASAMEHMPVTVRAVEDGDISVSEAQMLVVARREDPEIFERTEAQLVRAATDHSVGDLARVIGFWRQRVERERGRDGDEGLRAGRRLHASRTLGGMVRIDGDLDPETGESVLTALSAVMDAEVRASATDERTPPQRRADALGEICRGWLDLANRPTVGGERPHVTVTMDVGALTDPLGAHGEFDHAGPVGAGLVRSLACDASVMRVVMAGPSQPLDVGRRTSVVGPAMRRAVIVRDRTCRFPGCDRPHAWCDAHHIVHWADGGDTSIANLILLCRRHHRLIHERGGFSLTIDGDRPVFRRPDGSFLDDRAPP